MDLLTVSACCYNCNVHSLIYFKGRSFDSTMDNRTSDQKENTSLYTKIGLPLSVAYNIRHRKTLQASPDRILKSNHHLSSLGPTTLAKPHTKYQESSDWLLIIDNADDFEEFVGRPSDQMAMNCL